MTDKCHKYSFDSIVSKVENWQYSVGSVCKIEDDFNGDILIWWLSLAGEILLRLAVLWIVKIIFI